MKKKTYKTLVLVFALLSLTCVLLWYAYFKEKSGFGLIMVIIFSISTLVVLGKIILSRKGKPKKNTPPVKTEELNKPEWPDFKKAVCEYKPDLSLVDTPEKALENFLKCFELFREISDCMDNYSIEYLLSEKKKNSVINCLNTSYRNSEFANYSIWARLVTPTVDVIYNDCLRSLDHIPLLCTRYKFASDHELFDLFVYQFIKAGITIRFHL